MSASEVIKGMDVIVIDDAQCIRSLLTALLRDLNCHSVLSYESVDSACREIEKKRPSLVLCDWKMAINDGSVLLDRIRCNPSDEIAQTPVIIVSGYGSRDILESAIQKGATQFLVKPIVPQELIKKMYFTQKDERNMVRKNGRMVYVNPKSMTKPKVKTKSPRVLDTTKSPTQRQAPVSAAQTDTDTWEL